MSRPHDPPTCRFCRDDEYLTHAVVRDAIEANAIAIYRSTAALDSLDAAWAEAEAALPEGWHLILSSSPDAGHDAYARKPGSILPWEFAGNGPTPAAALRALAAKLQEVGG